MGTRADFYIGRGPSAEWIGSIAWDGNPNNVLEEIDHQHILAETDFRCNVLNLGQIPAFHKDDFTSPEDGWPWPWDNSCTTNYTYAWDDGIWVSCFGHGWMTVEQALDPESEGDGEGVCVFPNMSDKKSVTMGKRSGIMVFGVRK